MYNLVLSSAVIGVDGVIISVEADVSDGMPMFTMVGYLSSSVREAGERVKTALRNSGYILPPKRITINLSPADLKKEGSGFDLPIAVGILLSIGMQATIDMSKTLIIGELSLDGSVKPVIGVLSMADSCYRQGITTIIVAKENVREACIVKGLNVIGVATLCEATEYIQGKPVPDSQSFAKEDIISYCDEIDFSDIKGQAVMKRGMEIAAAGFHNVLMTGSAGAGKSMIAKRLPTIMPQMTFEESIEITKIYSIRGMLPSSSLITSRPFRSPHHTISSYALVGGGATPKPGEVSLAHNGVLFLDEFPEFNKNVLEVLRQPIEDRCITISRVNASYRFPADFMLVAAMNPCPCGNYPNLRKCTCSISQINHYQTKISEPLLDRIDINMNVRPVKYDELFDSGDGESSSVIRARVEEARAIQANRYIEESINFNSQLEGKLLKKYIHLGTDEESFLLNTFKLLDLSARGTYRILKLARTIADLKGSEIIRREHIEEAVFFRNNRVGEKEAAGYGI